MLYYLVIGICIFLLIAVIYISAKPISMGIEARREIQDQKSNNKSRDLNYGSDIEEDITNSKTNLSDEIIKKLDVRTSGSDALARSLSGGNLQKFVIGRELIQNPKIFIVNQPTWGVDAAAASSIRQQILDLAKDGAAVIVISQDLDELLEISDVFCALVGGQLSSPENTSELNPSKIGMLISNSKE